MVAFPFGQKGEQIGFFWGRLWRLTKGRMAGSIPGGHRQIAQAAVGIRATARLPECCQDDAVRAAHLAGSKPW